MILELADFQIHPQHNDAFETAQQRGISTCIARARGYEGFKFNRCIEALGRYVLQIFWTTLKDHTVGFRESSAFTDWRAIVGPFFARAPLVQHFDLVAKSA
ncbi:antibiotic biosynthesis monooxygenase family protein [Rhodoferax antarcticus]|uniref:ABM domain-containing protein n=1 Tax=Rhodoferax antarcticus ANT.BR TaxID=1111071 RepID=A0A1Q8YE24_9BURK|nr:antibiotic biosynthesis monooxygenase [Rhodoferax antarcticus]APW46127.1 antibiotic biosynthesis monooxygenase [Rhodoferax antarcticus]OLP06304.1 hypothetical protein BLL52_2535 [Rhodoferax antarcticus ANT.BR]